MRNVTRACVLVAVVGAFALPATADAATPRQATNRIASCMKHKAHAVRITKSDHGREGMAHFRGYWRFVSWSFITMNGRVLGTITAEAGLTRKQRRAANRCLRPFNGSV